ncbi:MAG: FG-GAP repeat protein [Candidatus Electrothrix aestuarii]|uniref:FG-GAP repeat protein n=1 Tax=Candidatus Electrothrix aestuarii TaxID=3062594 RepID=A0AAU8LYR6_9BACT
MMNRQRSRPILAVFLLATAFLPYQMQAATDSPTGLKLLASDKDDRNNFGYSVSISNDTALVGSKSACWYLASQHAGTWRVSMLVLGESAC